MQKETKTTSKGNAKTTEYVFGCMCVFMEIIHKLNVQCVWIALFSIFPFAFAFSLARSLPLSLCRPRAHLRKINKVDLWGILQFVGLAHGKTYNRYNSFYDSFSIYLAPKIYTGTHKLNKKTESIDSHLSTSVPYTKHKRKSQNKKHTLLMLFPRALLSRKRSEMAKTYDKP